MRVRILPLVLTALAISAAGREVRTATVQWTVEYVSDRPRSIGTPVSLGPGGTIYVATSSVGGPLYAFSPDGIRKWEYQFDRPVAIS